MKHWKDERNYCGIKDDNGNLIGGTIKVDGEEVRVTPEVLRTYSQGERRERYMKEQYSQGTLVSLEYLRENNVPLEKLEAALVSDPEDELLRKLDQKLMWDRLVPILNSLDKQDQVLIQAIFFNDISERDFAKALGISRSTLQNRIKRVICEIRRTIFE